MSDETWGFAPPPFKPEDALARLRRDLRDAGLTERGGVFERRGVAIARVAVDGTQLKAETVKRPSRNAPEWQARLLKTAAEVRDYTAELKKKLAGWSDSDD
ncbi:MAG: hypothetical protein KF891_17440 [Rhizobacter sp.]|nr:hypothetical protein [Rhizobacter sp.]